MTNSASDGTEKQSADAKILQAIKEHPRMRFERLAKWLKETGGFDDWTDEEFELILRLAKIAYKYS